MSDRRRVMGGTGSYKIYFNAIWNGGNPCYKVLGAPYWVSAVNEYDSNPSFVINYSTDSDISNKIFITSWAPTYDEMIEQWHVALSKIDTGYSVLYSNDID